VPGSTTTTTLAAGAGVLLAEVAAAAAVVVIVVAVPLPTATRQAADAATNATQATPATEVLAHVPAADFGVAAVVAAAAVVVVAVVVAAVIVALGERHLVHPVVEHTLVVHPVPRLVVHCPEAAGRGRQGERR
jgi:hypothetical protein